MFLNKKLKIKLPKLLISYIGEFRMLDETRQANNRILLIIVDFIQTIVLKSSNKKRYSLFSKNHNYLLVRTHKAYQSTDRVDYIGSAIPRFSHNDLIFFKSFVLDDIHD